MDVLPLSLTLGIAAYFVWPDFQIALDQRFGPFGDEAHLRANFAVYQDLLRDLAVVAYLVYATVAEALTGRTLGKAAINAVVVMADGSPMRPGRALARGAARVVSVAVCGLGLLWILVDPQNRTWHDLLAGTLVVRR